MINKKKLDFYIPTFFFVILILRHEILNNVKSSVFLLKCPTKLAGLPSFAAWQPYRGGDQGTVGSGPLRSSAGRHSLSVKDADTELLSQIMRIYRPRWWDASLVGIWEVLFIAARLLNRCL